MKTTLDSPFHDVTSALRRFQRAGIHAGGSLQHGAAHRNRHVTTRFVRSVVPSLDKLVLVALLAVHSAVHAIDLPKRKSGLWEIVTSQTGGPPGPTVQMCIDEKLDDLAKQLAAGAVTCSKQDVRQEGSRYVVDSVCRIDNSTATTRMVFTGSFDSSYKAEIEAKYSPPLMGMSEGRSTVTARWLGQCRSGQRAGDIVMPGGVTINLYDAPGGAPRK